MSLVSSRLAAKRSYVGENAINMTVQVRTTVNELYTLAATAVVRCTFTKDISDDENVGSVKQCQR